MKVEIKEPPKAFKPITITIETEEEYECLRAAQRVVASTVVTDPATVVYDNDDYSVAYYFMNRLLSKTKAVRDD